MTNTRQFVKTCKRLSVKESYIFQQQTHRLMELFLLMCGCWGQLLQKNETTGAFLGAERTWVLGKSYVRTAAVLGQKGRKKLVEI